jgi:hypothetical protein
MDLLPPSPSSSPPALDEFMRSIASIEWAPEEKSFALVNHKIFTWFLIGSYLVGVKGQDPKARKDGFGCLRKAFHLSAATGNYFDFSSQNSYVESYLAELFLERGDRTTAKGLLKSSVKHLFQNWTAWRMLGNVHKEDCEWPEAMTCFLTSAEGWRDRRALEEVARIARHWRAKGKISVGDLERVYERIIDFDESASSDVSGSSAPTPESS